MLNIKTNKDAVTIDTLIVMLYGQPSSGKTTLGFSAENSLLLDFDNGFYRAKNIQNYVPVKCWQDVAKISKDDLKGFDTIAIDTVGRSLDTLSTYLIESNSKYGQSDGALTLKGYMSLLTTYTNWIKSLRALHKNIVFLSHVKEEKDGETIILRPAIQGGSYNFIMQICDFVGYTYFINKKRYIDFNPCEKWHGKNSANFDAMEIPDFSNNPHFLAELISKMKSRLSELSTAQMEAMNEINTYLTDISLLNDVKEFTNYYYDLKPKTLTKALKAQIWAKLLERANDFNITFNKKDEIFEVSE